MPITFNKYAYFGTEGDAVATDSTGIFEVVVHMTPPSRNERMGPAQRREQENQQRIEAAMLAFNSFPNNIQIPVGQSQPLTPRATIKRLA